MEFQPTAYPSVQARVFQVSNVVACPYMLRNEASSSALGLEVALPERRGLIPPRADNSTCRQVGEQFRN